MTVLYVLANIAYLAAATKHEITTSGQLVVALLFKNVYGPQVERTLDICVAMSALGNVLSMVCRLALQPGRVKYQQPCWQLFSHGRVIQALGQEGFLPFSNFLASNRPFNTPFAGLFLSKMLQTSAIPHRPLPFNRLARMRCDYIRSSPRRRIQLCPQPRTLLLLRIHISTPRTHHLSTCTDIVPCIRHQCYYFVRHPLPLFMAVRWLAKGRRSSATGSRLFRSSERFSFRRSFCAPAHGWRALHQLTVLDACRSRLGDLWHRLFVLAGLDVHSTSDWRVHGR